MHTEADANIAFLFHKQLQEADLVCVTKSDLHATLPDLSVRHVRQISARTGQGVAAWLDEVLAGELSAQRMCSILITNATRWQRPRWRG
jgi:G3E family GTPase